MKKVLFFMLCCLTISASLSARPRAKRVVIIALDGISSPGFNTARTPNLDTLLSEGALSMTTRVVMPSVTQPNWTSHLTGSGPEQHGIVNNDWQVDKVKYPAVEVDAEGYYPSVFQILKNEIPECKTAFYYNWINLIYPYNQKYFDEISFLENDAYIPNYEKAFNFIVKNQNSPTLVLLYSGHTDHTGHQFKWMSSEYIKSIEDADTQIGVLINKMKKEGLYKDTHFMFLSDHGGVDYGHGGTTVDEMLVPWGIVGPGIKKSMKLEEPNNTVNTASTILHLFKVKEPLTWVGEVPYSIFK